ncbi:MAG: diguanylate cyclase [Thiomicrorhabdus sp.]|jgi:GAF domain-containing protein|nr:diguanylate cyclase [Thiomicrorhabdus sp.]
MQSTTSLYQNDPSCPIEANDSVSFAQLELLYQLQRNILEDVALTEGYKSVLRKLCLMAEEMVPNSLASIMLLDDNGLLNVLAAPSIPKEGINALNGLVPGPFGGSCGNTVYCEKPTFVCNILTDEKWQNLRAVAESFGLGSCWSMPVRISEDEIIGTFALTSFEPSSPTVFQRRILDTCAYIVSIILRRHQSDSKLEHLAYHDVLTGLPNRTYLQIAIEELILENEGFSLLMFGLDRFKIINDTHGHDIGDKVLVASANLLKSMLYEGLRLFHISGDEFVLLVIHSSRKCNSFNFPEHLIRCSES